MLFTRQNEEQIHRITAPFRSYLIRFGSRKQVAMSTPAADAQAHSSSKEPNRMRITAGGSIRHYVAFALASLRVSHVNFFNLCSVWTMRFFRYNANQRDDTE